MEAIFILFLKIQKNHFHVYHRPVLTYVIFSRTYFHGQVKVIAIDYFSSHFFAAKNGKILKMLPRKLHGHAQVTERSQV